MPQVRVGITAVGAALPASELTTAHLQERISHASGWALPPRLIEKITGIQCRRVALADEFASTLAIVAGRHALDRAGLSAPDLDLLIFASATRDVAEPATAHIVADALGCDAHCFDVSNACNSFLNGVDIARSMIMAGRAERALVVTGETPTRVMRESVADLAQARAAFAGFTFGDAGAAVLLEPVERGGILDIATATHSEHWRVGGVSGGGSRHPRGDEYTYFHGDGRGLRDVFEKVGTGILDALWERTGWGWTDFAAVLVHQVTMPYLDRFAEVTGVPRDRLEVTLPQLGNMASATLGVQLSRVHPRLLPGEKVLFLGLGGGVSLMTMVWQAS